ncbi:family 20 glycosylhydrolase [Actinotalea sp. AC32]|nr:family 20 glycosylhydrolase [Actinotalea sp. AC32]
MPLPLVVDAPTGTPVPLGAGSPVVADGRAQEVTAVVADRLARAGAARTGAGTSSSARASSEGEQRPVRLRLVDAVPGLAEALERSLGRDHLGQEPAREAYRLVVDADGALVEAVDLPGLLHGSATLASLVARDGAVHPVVVVDAPQYAWRGLSVDVARHPLALDELLVLVDLAADLRLNHLHLHLTDDQGWRLEVPSRPALTERSGGTAVDGDPGGFLTVADWASLVGHAAARGVTVVPEVDLPGHVNAALHAYGELTPDGEPAPAYTGIEVGFSRLHADLPATRPFLEDVLRDVAAMTPGAPVHVGGDEVLTMDRDEYARLVRTAADVVEAQGRTVVAWQEAAKAPLTPGTVLQLWDEREDTADLVAAVRDGARLLLSPASRVYLDMKYDATSPLGLEWAGHVPLERSYDWDPSATVPGVPPEAVVGVEAAVWSETTRSLADVTWLLLPRLAAVAEVAWSAQGRRELADFTRRVPAVARRWDAAGLRWHRTPGVRW